MITISRTEIMEIQIEFRDEIQRENCWKTINACMIINVIKRYRVYVNGLVCRVFS